MEILNEIQENDSNIVDESQEPQTRHAGFWIRFIASCIDVFIIAIFYVILAYLLEIIEIDSLGMLIADNLFVFFLFMCCLYFVFMIYEYKTTLGRMVVGIRATSSGQMVDKGNPILKKKWLLITSIIIVVFSVVGLLVINFIDAIINPVY